MPPRRAPSADSRSAGAASARLLGLLYFASGASGLVYQVIWVRELGLLLGATATAAATTLAAFFLGLGLGNAAFGAVADRVRSPLRLYATIEAGIALAAIALPFVFRFLRDVYPSLFPLVGAETAFATSLRAAIATVVLLPATVLMGASWPALARAFEHGRESEPARAAVPYALNILGAAAGTAAAGFALPLALGIAGTNLVAVAINAAVAAVAFAKSKGGTAPLSSPAAPALPETAAAPLPRALFALAALSGFGTIALEVLFTHMLARSFQNSVYSFAAIVVVFLVALAAGSLAAAALERRRDGDRMARVGLACALAAPAVALAGPVFMAAIGYRYFVPVTSLAGYLARLLGSIALTIGAPAFLAGLVFPLLFGAARRRGETGRALGRLTAVNTAGSIAGSLAAGFLLLPLAGLWWSLAIVAALYAAAGALLRPRAGVPLGVLALLVGLGAAAGPFRLGSHVVRGQQELEWLRETRGGLIAVLREGGDRYLRADNFYELGSSASTDRAVRQGAIPVLLHPAPKRVLFIGLATGITAAGALADARVESVTAAELLPEVAEAARFFAKWNGNALDDPRLRVVVADGRNFVSGTRERFDCIISDLFVPWHAGTGSLYSREYYEAARGALAPGGLYAQWLQMDQFSRLDFEIVAATFAGVFRDVRVVRGDFSTDRPLLGLIGWRDGAPAAPAESGPVAATIRALTSRDVAPDIVLREIRDLSLFDCGPLEPVPTAAPNTDDRPLIEYLAPLSHIERNPFRGAALVAWLGERTPPSPGREFPGGGEAGGYPRAAFAFFKAGVEVPIKRSVDEFLAALIEANRLAPDAQFLADQLADARRRLKRE